jgi:group II intron reverse transcriptase/maturase
MRARNTEAGVLDAMAGNTRFLLERICSRENMREAYKRVTQNRGAGGVDGMQTDELNEWLRDNYDALEAGILSGKYRPKPVRRVEIPKKEKGKVRLLGIPTVVGRMVRQAVAQRLTPVSEPRSHRDSYGLRPSRPAHDALLAARRHADAGDAWAASMDLGRLFDTVDQSRLVQLLSDSPVDRRVVSLMHRFLMAGVMVDGVVMPTEEGAPRGGPPSPLLASIPLIIALLTGLLKLVFSRYAGNFPIDIPPDRLALLVVVGMVAYAAVAALHVRRIRKVPLSLALKAQE